MLADRVKKPPTNALPGPGCSVGLLLATLEDAERDALVVMLGTPENRSPWTAEAIYKVLTEEGHSVGRQTIGRHRARRCSCFR